VVGILVVDRGFTVFLDPQPVFNNMNNMNDAKVFTTEELIGKELTTKLKKDIDKYEIRGEKADQIMQWALLTLINANMLEMIRSGEVDVVNIEPVEIQTYEAVIANPI